MRYLAVLFFALPFMAQPAGFILLLDDQPVTAGTLAPQLAVRAGRHAVLRTRLAARNIPVTGETFSVLNAIFVDADPARRSELSAMPGVRAVLAERRFQLLLDRAEQMISVPAAWSSLGGTSTAGAGIRIAVIDTGVQSTHPAMRDVSMTAPAGFPVCSIYNQPQTPLDCAKYTNSKVIVARSYVPLISGTNAATSRPDDYTPTDHVGHGTAVATAAAGATATGPAATITGVAPKAWIGSYKVFGSPGVLNFSSSSAIINALEDAYNDKMDIAVLSLGGPALSGPLDNCGFNNVNDPCDAEAAAIQNAVALGMVVVAAAGNEGSSGTTVKPTLATAASPGHAPNAISVGALTSSHRFSTGLDVPGLGSFHALLGSGPSPGQGFTAPLSDAGSVGDSQACTALPPASLTGTIALVQRGTCTFLEKVLALQDAGAAGAIIVNNPGDDSIFSPGGLGGATAIPATLVGYSDGQSIRNFASGNRSASARILAALQPFEVSSGNQVATFSSRGPALATGGIKPDISAVGTDLFLSGQDYDPNGALYSRDGYLVSQGTSFSAPQVAGVAALVKQAHPGIPALGVKSAIVNTADQDVTDNGLSASVVAMGSGRVNAASAIRTNVVASPSSLAFGILRNGLLPVSQQIQLTNLGATPLNVTVSIDRRTPENTAHTSIDRAAVTVAANGNAGISVTLAGSLPAPGSYEGFIVVQGGNSTLRIPFLYLVGNGVPYNVTPIVGDGDDGTVGQSTAIGYVFVQLTDRFGVPVANAPARFSVSGGGGTIRALDSTTDVYGIGAASVTLGPNPGVNTYEATAGGLSTTFRATARNRPTISASGVVDAASFRPNTAVSPGSYVAIFGSDLAPSTKTAATPNLPLAIRDVSAGFSAGTVSTPGHLHFITAQQVNVQVPWELAGKNTTQLKVSVGDSSGNLYTLPLAAYSPGLFTIPSGSATLAAARDENFNTITLSNPAKQGRVIQLYCNGLGPVTNQPASGDPSPVSPLAETTTRPVVTIGGQNAAVQFSGLTPTAVGLYQINVTVPPQAAPGLKAVAITIGGVTSQTESLPVE